MLSLPDTSSQGGALPLPGTALGRRAADASRFVGRIEELFDVERLLAQVRLVTLVGPAGIGKTRLALRYAFGRRGPDDAVWCDLSEARAARTLAATLADAVGLADARGPDAATGIARMLSTQGQALVVLDNFDHLVECGGTALVGRWIAAAPSVRWLVTSRQPLRLEDEVVFDVGPLPVPRPGARPERTEAVELFVDRVRATRGTYDPSVESLRVIADIVRQLGGVPLAIELAAARADAIDPHRLLARLWRHLRVVSANDHGRPARQMTMDQAVDWSWGMLSALEQTVLRQTSVFRGGFTVAAATEVVRFPGPGAGASLSQVLRALREKSLLRDAGPGRYDMFESTRTFAARALRAAREAEATAERHAEYVLGLAFRIGSKSGEGGREVEWAVAERENLRALLEWGVGASRPAAALHAALALDVLSSGNGLPPSDLDALEAAIEIAPRTSAVERRLVGRAHAVQATALRVAGRVAEAARAGAIALEDAVGDEDLEQILAVRSGLAESRYLLGEFEAARGEAEACLALARELGDLATEALVLQRLGSVNLSLGAAETARGCYESALEIGARIEDPRAEARAALGLGSYWLVMGEHAQARTCYEHGLAIARTIEMRRIERVAIAYLGLLEFDAGRIEQARARLEEAVAAARSVGSVVVEGLFSAVLGGVLCAQGDLESARARLGTAETVLADNPFFLGVARIYRGCLEASLGQTEAARRRLHEARTGQARLAERSDDARIALRILERALGPRP